MRRFRAVAITAAVAMAVITGSGVTPAHASNVNVKFGVSAGYWAPTGAACTVSVPAGANGLAVLDAAVADGCILSYDTQSFGGQPYVSCINEICQIADGLVSFWAMFENSPIPAEYGAGDFRADEGDELVFAYTNFAVLMPFYL